MKKLLGIFALLLVLCLACTGLAIAEEEKAEYVTVVAWGEEDFITELNGHDVTDGPNWITEPTCTTDGVARYHCDELDEPHFHTVIVKAPGHQWASESGVENWGRIIEFPTCTKDGKAQDECVICHETREVYRTIKGTHEFPDPDTALENGWYKVIDEPTCTKEGLAQVVCRYCGYTDDTCEQFTLDKLPHNFTDWKIEEEANCGKYGKAYRVCLWCDLQQELSEEHQIDNLLNTVDGVKKLNANWTNKDDGKQFSTLSEYEAWKKTINFKYDVIKEWNIDCYTCELTFSCPICHGQKVKLADGTKAIVHPDFKIQLLSPLNYGHIWNEKPENFTTDEEPGISVAPTCTEPGYLVYLCKYDEDHDHTDIEGLDYEEIKALDVPPTIDAPQGDLRLHVVPLDALGHDWSEWVNDYNYKKDGKEVPHYTRYCLRCGKVDNTTDLEAYNPDNPAEPEIKDGLTLDEDGEWRYYEDGEFMDEYKGVVEYNGGEFIVYNGVKGHWEGLTACPGDKFYYLSDGQIQRVTQLAEYQDEWFAIKNGELDTSVNGIVNYNGGKFVFSLGRLCREYNGLWYNADDGEFYFLAQGQVQDQFSGVTYFDGEFFLLKNGKLDVDYNDYYNYNGQVFRVVNGQLY